MKKKTKKILWLVCAICFSAASIYSTYYVSPELGLTYGLGLLALSFPSGIVVPTIAQLLLFLLFGVKKINILGSIFINILVILSGYYQWFLVIPYIKEKNKNF